MRMSRWANHTQNGFGMAYQVQEASCDFISDSFVGQQSRQVKLLCTLATNHIVVGLSLESSGCINPHALIDFPHNVREVDVNISEFQTKVDLTSFIAVQVLQQMAAFQAGALRHALYPGWGGDGRPSGPAQNHPIYVCMFCWAYFYIIPAAELGELTRHL
ncbi:hypothetical protein CB1_000349019 [Camelus ferus]|nr:hypothetical protein CB1_000349019 [Camelus ferus]